jgi:hypothetical protein
VRCKQRGVTLLSATAFRSVAMFTAHALIIRSDAPKNALAFLKGPVQLGQFDTVRRFV